MSEVVSLLKCDEYDHHKLKDILNKSIENIGGLEQYFTPGEKVLFKVNLLMKKTPEEVTTTNPVFVAALAEIFMEYGLEILIGDSPGGPFNDSIVNPIYRASGMENVAKTTGAKLNRNYNSCEKENPKGLMLKRITVVDMLNDVDKVVSVSKLKTHGMMTFTGAVKNQFGIIPGILKAEYHLNMPEKDDFANALLDICLCANPVLSFMDGITAMEGEGPSAGTPRQVNAVLASPSPYHLDKVACDIISLPHADVPTIRNSIKRGIVSEGLTDIELLGDPIENFIITDFEIPNVKELNPLRSSKFNFVNRILGNKLKPKPVFNHEDCIGCSICANNCPAKVIKMEDKRPHVELEGCIRCFCCQELCPAKAVVIKRPLLLKIINR